MALMNDILTDRGASGIIEMSSGPTSGQRIEL
jgi:hypothetical protein